MKLEVLGRQITVAVVACFEFTSTRKRSSVIVHFEETATKFGIEGVDAMLTSGRHVLYCKV